MDIQFNHLFYKHVIVQLKRYIEVRQGKTKLHYNSRKKRNVKFLGDNGIGTILFGDICFVLDTSILWLKSIKTADLLMG